MGDTIHPVLLNLNSTTYTVVPTPVRSVALNVPRCVILLR